MTCVNCGAELKDGAKFCAKCGTKQEAPPPAEVPMIQVCGKCDTPLKEGAKFCAKCGASAAEAKSVPAPVEKPSPAPVAPDTAPNMMHMTSLKNPWEFDIPAYFKSVPAMTFEEQENSSYMSPKDQSVLAVLDMNYFYVACPMCSAIRVPAAYSLLSNIMLAGSSYKSFPDFIAARGCVPVLRADDPMYSGEQQLLAKTQGTINGLTVEYHEYETRKKMYAKAAFAEKGGFYYAWKIVVPLEQKEQRGEEMDAFINSFRLNG